MKIVGTENELRNFTELSRKCCIGSFIDNKGKLPTDDFDFIEFMGQKIGFEVEDEQEPDYRKQLEMEYEERINQLEREKEQFICHIWELEYKLAEDMFRKTTAEIIDAAEIDTKEELIWGLKAFIIHMIPGALVVLAFLLGHFG